MKGLLTSLITVLTFTGLQAQSLPAAPKLVVGLTIDQLRTDYLEAFSSLVANIQPSNYNPRKRFDETGLDELAESIKQQGVLQPITVRPIADTDRYEIVFGERRYRASVIAGLEEVPAIISELSDEEAQEMAVTENLQRKDVTPTEEANAYKQLIDSGRC